MNQCIDCGIDIYKDSKRCNGCNALVGPGHYKKGRIPENKKIHPKCLICNKEVPRISNKYCSQKCAYEARTKRPKQFCGECGCIIPRTYRTVKRCGVCHRKWRKSVEGRMFAKEHCLKGEETPNWKGGISKTKKYHDIHARKWRKKNRLLSNVRCFVRTRVGITKNSAEVYISAVKHFMVIWKIKEALNAKKKSNCKPKCYKCR